MKTKHHRNLAAKVACFEHHVGMDCTHYKIVDEVQESYQLLKDKKTIASVFLINGIIEGGFRPADGQLGPIEQTCVDEWFNQLVADFNLRQSEV